MRLQSLLALTAAGALLLPMAAQADWPAGKKDAYMQQCVQVATQQGVSAKDADTHCKCGAQAIEKNFSKAEIEDLDSKDGVDAKLMQKAQTVVKQACTTKG
ncbi:hypothetical protein WLF18_02510 [Pseudomonas shirazensis]|jgi:hypothetical protein|uniref:Secreted protein n=3 Tax=Pseudomonas TaxID=286 RepID=A0A2S3WFT3_PSEPU|nr:MULTISPECIES: hypothetical protein [Pseudomonas]AUF96947.1 hypothetical protein CXQ80_14420 [Pseudomonas sp. 02C 26]MBA1195698.1 hypothetical protein [Pseudomonas plecoglossicida]MBA1321307.1 hypothetical protein [Pseudomonas plecoglossicida]MBO0367579.1 hypothetical protein [Pseudomonas putida]MBV4500439.1 hypothetical protein [Pseudomonas shirazensis]